MTRGRLAISLALCWVGLACAIAVALGITHVARHALRDELARPAEVQP